MTLLRANTKLVILPHRWYRLAPGTNFWIAVHHISHDDIYYPFCVKKNRNNIDSSDNYILIHNATINFNVYKEFLYL